MDLLCPLWGDIYTIKLKHSYNPEKPQATKPAAKTGLIARAKCSNSTRYPTQNLKGSCLKPSLVNLQIDLQKPGRQNSEVTGEGSNPRDTTSSTHFNPQGQRIKKKPKGAWEIQHKMRGESSKPPKAYCTLNLSWLLTSLIGPPTKPPSRQEKKNTTLEAFWLEKQQNACLLNHCSPAGCPPCQSRSRCPHCHCHWETSEFCWGKSGVTGVQGWR